MVHNLFDQSPISIFLILSAQEESLKIILDISFKTTDEINYTLKGKDFRHYLPK